MNYSAEYTVLIDGATWGREDYEFYAENDNEAIILALEHEKSLKGRKELLLDYIYDENGKEIDWVRL